ncbi:C6 finger domain-containing protein [Histoplasma capsulatum var. duboisii H88]|uniref:C6 finger domain-containing protein n=2 Tax=Ajellomyces capsulatus TaxID=5037 RepID=F0URQ9_AJEC8|nr:C6 finger domain-containing protein [Histoplasma capsulatum H143]EGC48586.1 C6 finger domain-containing protein [Histoplasma capsulatum var. duboisii H88]QSS50590.1 C6 finger domain-containing protein [Histoplasma capsulatum var. duboisii H88]
MSSYFPPGGPAEGYDAPSTHAAAQFAAHPDILTTPQYPHTNSVWHYSHQPHMPPPETPHAHFQMASAPSDRRKHKRTRSGCFTCRSRRVKCDETHPICDRCSKGKRDCVYPPPQVRRTGSRTNLGAAEKPPTIPESESSDENNGGTGNSWKKGTEKKEELKEEDHPSSVSPPVSRPRATISRSQSAQSLVRRKGRPPKSPSDAHGRDNFPISDVISTISGCGNEAATFECSLKEISNLPGVSKLKYDVQFFLAYHRHIITFRHYFMRQDAQSFITKDLLMYAVQYEPLLYAVIGFSAYICSIRHPNGKLYTFLKYYNKSVTGLLKSLSTNSTHHDAMLLTILQLATFEEYLGDWVSVTDHHQAAQRMLTELYTPEKINENEFRRYMFLWYARFDVVSGILAGSEAILSPEWYIACESFAVEEEAKDPGNINKQFYTCAIRTRRVGMDMASLIANASRMLISTEEFERQNHDITARLDKIQEAWNSLASPDHLVMSFPNKVPLGPDDIVDPYVPGRIYDESYWDVNCCLVDILGTRMMHKYQTGLLLQQLDLAELQSDALELCGLIETMERWPNRPKDWIIQVQSSLALSTLFIPSDEKHIMWCRKLLAKVEQFGFVYPSAFRSKMADLWQLPELRWWWLRNDEGCPKLVREIREWTGERELNPRDTFREDVRDLKTMFWRMSIDDTSSSGSCTSNTLTPPTTVGLYSETSPSEPTP